MQQYEITLIAAMNSDRIIGADGDIPWRVRADMRHFKETTMGHDIIVGRRTYQSIQRISKNGPALPGRHVIVLSRTLSMQSTEALTVVRTAEQALACARMPQDKIFVAGGAEIYELFLPHASRMHLTHIDAVVEGSDTLAHFPEWHPGEWVEERHQGLECSEGEPHATLYQLRRV